MRIDQGVPTVSDFLNMEAVGDYYYNYGNGFNFGNLSTLIILYGAAAPFICFTLACLYKLLFTERIRSNRSADTTFIYILFLLFFTESIGSLHWIIYALFMIGSIKLFSNALLNIK
jgi:hypothetical protein